MERVSASVRRRGGGDRHAAIAGDRGGDRDALPCASARADAASSSLDVVREILPRVCHFIKLALFQRKANLLAFIEELIKISFVGVEEGLDVLLKELCSAVETGEKDDRAEPQFVLERDA